MPKKKKTVEKISGNQKDFLIGLLIGILLVVILIGIYAGKNLLY